MLTDLGREYSALVTRVINMEEERKNIRKVKSEDKQLLFLLLIDLTDNSTVSK